MAVAITILSVFWPTAFSMANARTYCTGYGICIMYVDDFRYCLEIAWLGK